MRNVLQENLVKIKKIASLNKVLSLYVFGSYAREQTNESSDLDVLLVTKDTDNPDEVSLKFTLGLFPRDYDLEVISCAFSDLQKKIQENSFFNTITKEGKLIYGSEIV